MKIAVVAMGSVGIILGDKLMRNGHEVKYGVRFVDSEKTKQAMSSRPEGATVDSVPNAVSWAEAVILATPSFHDNEEIKDVAKSLGDGVAGKVIADATNPLTEYPGMEVRWDIGTSGAEVLQEALPTAKVTKVFNTISTKHMIHSDGSAINGKQLTMLFACDPTVKEIASAITSGVGFDPVYVGPLRYARNLEAIAELWIHMGMLKTSGDIGSNFHFQFISDNKP